MAYVNRGSSRNRAATGVVVALIQGAAVYALVTGLVVHILPEKARENPGSDPITVTPMPKPKPEPVPDPDPKTVDPRTSEQTKAHVPVNEGVETTTSIFTTTTTNTTAGGGGESTAIEQKPEPLPRFVPKIAMPRNNPGTWATTSDYPASDIRAGNQGSTHFRLSIGTDGKVLGCEVIGTSGSSSLDAATCRLVTKRARFSPATDGSGSTILGTYSSAIRWEIPKD